MEIDLIQMDRVAGTGTAVTRMVLAPSTALFAASPPGCASEIFEVARTGLRQGPRTFRTL